MSALGDEGAVYLSEYAFARVRDRCRVLAVGPVRLKGKGELEVYRCDALL